MGKASMTQTAEKANQATSAATFSTAVDAAVEGLLSGGGRVEYEALRAAAAPVLDLKETAKDAGVPKDIVTLVDSNSTAKPSKALVEEAISDLNRMIEQAQKRLDNKTDSCMEFKAKSDAAITQVKADITRLGEQISSVSGSIIESNSEIYRILGMVFTSRREL